MEEFLEHGVVALGDDRLGALQAKISKEELLRRYAEHYPAQPEGSRAVWASQLFRLISEIKVGDEVATYDRDRRRYVLGEVTSEYEWLPNAVPEMPHVRRVKWTRETPRDVLETTTRNSLGAIQSLFRLSPEATEDLRRNGQPLGTLEEQGAAAPPRAVQHEPEVVATIREETLAKADEFIEDAMDALNWEQMQELVAGILRAMGYRTIVSGPGPDRGVDIFASPDGLGLQEPRIFVEVKHRVQVIGSREVRSFLGGRKRGDRCLYVSTGGFTKDAYYEADRADVPIALVTLPRLRALLLEHYERLDPETRALVPLRRLYWPVAGT
jgi:restriction system protein